MRRPSMRLSRSEMSVSSGAALWSYRRRLAAASLTLPALICSA